MLEQIRGKSLDELEDLMGRFSRDDTGDDVQDDTTDIVSDQATAEAQDDREYRQARLTRVTSIFARFAWRSEENREGESISGRASSISIRVSSSSEFIPSSERE